MPPILIALNYYFKIENNFSIITCQTGPSCLKLRFYIWVNIYEKTKAVKNTFLNLRLKFV
jgi:hypothetical protein